MQDARWSPADGDEVDALFTEAIGEPGKPSHDRVRDLLDGLNDAINAQRQWASELHSKLLYRGATATLRGEIKSRASVGIAYNGQIVTKPRMVGAVATMEDGTRVSTLRLWDDMTFEEIGARVIDSIKQRNAYDVNIATGKKLLSLATLAPEARTPREACESIGTTVDAYLAEEAA